MKICPHCFTYYTDQNFIIKNIFTFQKENRAIICSNCNSKKLLSEFFDENDIVSLEECILFLAENSFEIRNTKINSDNEELIVYSLHSKNKYNCDLFDQNKVTNYDTSILDVTNEGKSINIIYNLLFLKANQTILSDKFVKDIIKEL